MVVVVVVEMTLHPYRVTCVDDEHARSPVDDPHLLDGSNSNSSSNGTVPKVEMLIVQLEDNRLCDRLLGEILPLYLLADDNDRLYHRRRLVR